MKKNYEQLGLKPNLIIGNALNVMSKLSDKYTVAYVDPPYASGIYQETVEKLQNLADFIILEHPADMQSECEGIIKRKKYGDKMITYIK